MPVDDLRNASDETLAQAVKRGDRDAFAVLVDRHQQRVYAVAYRYTRRHEDALDVAQEALLKAYRNIGQWRPTGAFQAWLIRVTVNQAIDHRRRTRRHREALQAPPMDQGPSEPSAPAVDETDRRAGQREIDARVAQALDVLSPAQRTTFILRHYEGMTLAEIAPVLGCSVGSVKVHLFRALRKLRGELSDLQPGGK